MTAVVGEAGARRAGDGPGDALDVVVSGLVRVRLVGATAADRRAVEAQLGPAEPAGTGVAHITLRYVDRLPVPEGMRLLGPGEVGVADGALVVLRGRFRRPARVRIDLSQLGGPCEVVCEHGVGRVPHLVALLNLAVLATGGVALHASAVDLDGRGVVATGWSKGGKTEAVLALVARGATLVGDEWVHLLPDGTACGIREPLRVWDWQLRQLPTVRAATPAADRCRLRALGLATAVAQRRSPRVATALDRQRFVDLDQDRLAPGRDHRPRRVGAVLLVTSALRADVVVRPLDGREVADRMVASLAYERRPLRDLADAHRFAFPSVALRALDEAAERERAVLHDRLDAVPAHEVLHPHPMSLSELGDRVLDALEAAP